MNDYPRASIRRIQVSMVREGAIESSMGPSLFGASVSRAGKAASLFRSLVGDDPREYFMALYLDGRHQPIAIHTVAIGGPVSCPVNPAQVFLPAVGLGACSVIVAHNHPSGKPEPSKDDNLVTKRLTDAGYILSISMDDHLILGQSKFYSIMGKFAEAYE